MSDSMSFLMSMIDYFHIRLCKNHIISELVARERSTELLIAHAVFRDKEKV